eukprot:TRINITY_DN1878_c0_g1_i1.p1 TRINITY_DN1878_c0_g1~~TRINITY_DN1878_c0_g1_i1.p1  ORF type:complete len:465 (-),score=141.64 TRINITY_DN1878_c0_g1_i1:108-1502(-)
MTIHSKFPCNETLHPFFDSCRVGPYFCRTAFLASAKIYLPLFLLSGLLSKKAFSVSYVVYKLLPSVFRSSAMIAIIGLSWGDLVCRLRNLFGAHYRINYFIAPFVGSLIGILIEKQQRRGELVVYVLNNLADNVYRMLLSRRLVREIPHGLTYLFAAAIGVLHMFLVRHRELLGGSERALMQTVIGVEQQPDALERCLHRGCESLRRLLLPKAAGGATEEVPAAADGVRQPAQPLCVHQGACIEHTAIGLGRGFLIGYSLQCALRLLPSLFALSKWFDPTSRQKLLRKSFGAPTVKFGLFLGLLSGVTRGVQCLLRNFRRKEDGWNQVVSGVAGGLSFALSGSVELCMFMASKACDVGYKYAKFKGYVRPVPGGQVMLFALATASIFSILFWEPHNLRPSYLAYLNKATFGLMSDLVVSTHELRLASGMSQANTRSYLHWYNGKFRKYLRDAVSSWAQQHYRPS